MRPKLESLRIHIPNSIEDVAADRNYVIAFRKLQVQRPVAGVGIAVGIRVTAPVARRTRRLAIEQPICHGVMGSNGAFCLVGDIGVIRRTRIEGLAVDQHFDTLLRSVCRRRQHQLSGVVRCRYRRVGDDGAHMCRSVDSPYVGGVLRCVGVHSRHDHERAARHVQGSRARSAPAAADGRARKIRKNLHHTAFQIHIGRAARIRSANSCALADGFQVQRAALYANIAPTCAVGANDSAEFRPFHKPASARKRDRAAGLVFVRSDECAFGRFATIQRARSAKRRLRVGTNVDSGEIRIAARPLYDVRAFDQQRASSLEIDCGNRTAHVLDPYIAKRRAGAILDDYLEIHVGLAVDALPHELGAHAFAHNDRARRVVCQPIRPIRINLFFAVQFGCSRVGRGRRHRSRLDRARRYRLDLLLRLCCECTSRRMGEPDRQRRR